MNLNTSGSRSDSPSSTTSRNSSARYKLNPHEEALQLHCKRLLKSILFRGYFVERRYVDAVNGYRDIVVLQRSEKVLEKLLLEISLNLHTFYQHSTTHKWFGITTSRIPDISKPVGSTLNCYIWTDVSELAFGQYWFNIRGIRFRENEIILKIKMLRPVENETNEATTPLRRKFNTEEHANADSTQKEASAEGHGAAADNEPVVPKQDVQFQDFVDIVKQWGESIKLITYHFLSHDINKENIIGFLKFMGLLMVSLLTFAVQSVKFLGIFTLRFMFETSRLTHALTPILLKIIDLFNKIVGGFYLLIAMVFRDLLINRGRPQPIHNQQVEYNRPMYKSIEYNVRVQQKQARLQPPRNYADFERKFQ